MIYASCEMWLRDYNCDGLRFDSANDLPADLVKDLTWKIRDAFPGRILTAEVTPENPMSVRELGFDSVWVRRVSDVALNPGPDAYYVIRCTLGTLTLSSSIVPSGGVIMEEVTGLLVGIYPG